MSRADRSRSPTTTDALRISKVIAGFGRYPSKRPPGLHVDQYGCMKLDDIMRYWGHGQGLEEKHIMHAVRKHMFRETNEGGSLRFALDGDAAGCIVVRVMPSQDDHGRHHGRRHSLTDKHYDGVFGRAFGTRPPDSRIPKMIGSVLKTPLPAKSPLANGTNRLNGNGSKHNKLDMSLDDLIQTDQVIDLEADDGANHRKREQVMRSFRQMGLTAETSHLRRAPQDSNGFHSGGRRRDDAWQDKGRRRWSPAEKVQRWIAWVVQRGYKELGIMLAEGGWVDIAALAAAIPQSRPDFGEFDAEKLKVFIQDSDVDGRFEINPSNQLRKVPKDMRKAKSQRSPFERSAAGTAAPRDPMDTIEVESSASSGRGRRARSPSLSSNSDEMGPNDDLEDAALAAQCENLRVSGDVEDAKEVKAETRWPTVTAPPKPDPPPGEYWTKYQDENGGEEWYFYEGPLGQWWSCADATSILPYVPDS